MGGVDDIASTNRMVIDAIQVQYGVCTDTYAGVMENIAPYLPKSVTMIVTVRDEKGEKPRFCYTLGGPCSSTRRSVSSDGCVFTSDRLSDGRYVEVMTFAPDVHTSFNHVPEEAKDVPLSEVFTSDGEPTNAVIGNDVYIYDEYESDDTLCFFVCTTDGLQRDVTVLRDGDDFSAFYGEDVESSVTVSVSGDVMEFTKRVKGPVKP